MEQKTEVQYRDRRTQQIVTETIAAEAALRWLYEHPVGVKVFTYLLNNAIFSWLYGKSQDFPWSRKKIPAFVAKFAINAEEFEHPLSHYRSFNAFFTRRLKPRTRLFTPAPEALCAPGDGKVLVYPHVTEFTGLPVKGAVLPLASLLASEEAARAYYGGAALILRLAPYDYHRFHFPDAGEAPPARLIPGQYHSVNPIALAQVPDVFCRNKRTITMLSSENFGCTAYIEVGATAVASICQTYTPGPVQRGQEKGYFQYGGSTVILLFEPHTIVFDEDLVRDTRQDLEVQVLTGSRIGGTP